MKKIIPMKIILFFCYNKKRNTIEISSSKVLDLRGNFINSKNNFINNQDNIMNNSFHSLILVENEMNKAKLILPGQINFSYISNKYINLPLFQDKDIFRKEPFSQNLILMDQDSDVESLENSILKDKEFMLKELNYGILSYQQKQYDLDI